MAKIFVKHKLPQATTSIAGQQILVKNQKPVQVEKTPEVIAYLNSGRLVETEAPEVGVVAPVVATGGKTAETGTDGNKTGEAGTATGAKDPGAVVAGETKPPVVVGDTGAKATGEATGNAKDFKAGTGAKH